MRVPRFGGENADVFLVGRGKLAPAKPSAPFAAVHGKSRRIERVTAPLDSVSALACGKLCRRKSVAPAEVVPIIHVKRDWNKTRPQARIRLQLAEPRLGRRGKRRKPGSPKASIEAVSFS